MARRANKDQQKKSYSGLNLRETARSRPVATAAVATAAAAAGAYFLSRQSGSGSESKPLMNWGRNKELESPGSTRQDSMLETAGSTPSAAAGTSIGGSSIRKPPRSR